VHAEHAEFAESLRQLASGDVAGLEPVGDIGPNLIIDE
jgi:hypothetical protein